MILHLGVDTPRVRDKITGFVGVFSDLLSSSENKIDNFAKTIHGANSARHVNGGILISSRVIQGFKSIQFELKDRAMCNSLPETAALTTLDDAQI